MTIQLFDLAGENPRYLFSPFAWRVRMALLHKGLEFEITPWRFSDRSATEAQGFSAIPVLRDGDTWVGDSWEIVRYLDRQYPDRPALMADAAAEAHARLVGALCGSAIFPAAIRIAVYQAFLLLDEASKPYFRESRETMFGQRLEDINAAEDEGRAGLATALRPFEEVLGVHDYLAGESPAHADFMLFGVLKWADIVSRYAPLVSDSAVGRWFTRLEQAYGGHAGSVPRVRG